MLCARFSTWAWTWNRFMGTSGLQLSAITGSVFDGTAGALAAVLGQVAEKSIHASVVGAVDDVAAKALLHDEPGCRELLQVKGKSVRRNGKALGHGARRETRLADHDEGAEDIEADRLSESRQCRDDLILIHISSIVESDE